MIVSLYAGGMTVRDIQHHLTTSLRVDISPDTISAITDAVLEEVMVWQQRELDEFYPVIFLDALRIKVRDGGRVMNKAVYIAIGVDMEGIKHMPYAYGSPKRKALHSGHRYAPNLPTAASRTSSLSAAMGSTALKKPCEATWPNSMVQTCVVHLIRAATRWVSYSDRKGVTKQLREIYNASSVDEAKAALQRFESSPLGQKYPQSVKVWRDAWDRFIPFLQFPPEARKVIYTTNSIESLNNELRKATRNRVQFPNDDSAIKTLWLMICNIEDRRAAQRKKNAKTLRRYRRPARRRSKSTTMETGHKPNGSGLPRPLRNVHLAPPNYPHFRLPHTKNLTRSASWLFSGCAKHCEPTSNRDASSRI